MLYETMYDGNRMFNEVSEGYNPFEDTLHSIYNEPNDTVIEKTKEEIEAVDKFFGWQKINVETFLK